MADNVLETIQKLVQDVIAPDVRELKARVDSLEHRMDDRFKALEQRMDDRFAIVDQKFSAMDQKIDAKFDKVLAAIAALRTEGELAAVREISALRERVAVLELQHRQSDKAA